MKGKEREKKEWEGRESVKIAMPKPSPPYLMYLASTLRVPTPGLHAVFLQYVTGSVMSPRLGKVPEWSNYMRVLSSQAEINVYI